MKNNFNHNSGGLSIQASIYRDSDESSYRFDENFIRLDNDMFLFTDCGNITPELGFTPKTMAECYKDEIKNTEELQEFLSESPEIKENLGLDCLMLSELLAFFDLCDVEKFLEKEFEFEIIESRGYSQGDSCTVIVPVAKLAELWGKEVDINEMQKTIDNYFWDAPFYFSLEVDGEELLNNGDLYDCDVLEHETETNKILVGVAKALSKSDKTDAEQVEINRFLALNFTDTYTN